jgi:superfamily II RNA helicase
VLHLWISNNNRPEGCLWLLPLHPWFYEEQAQCFAAAVGAVSVLCVTSTLAAGINLPAAASPVVPFAGAAAGAVSMLCAPSTLAAGINLPAVHPL